METTLDVILDIIMGHNLTNVAVFFDSSMVTPDTLWEKLVRYLADIPYICHEWLLYDNASIINDQVILIKESGLSNIFIIANKERAQTAIEIGQSLRMILANGYQWFVMTMGDETLDLRSGFDTMHDTAFIHIRPRVKNPQILQRMKQLLWQEPALATAENIFGFDLLGQTISSLYRLRSRSKLPDNGSLVCPLNQQSESLVMISDSDFAQAFRETNFTGRA